MRPVVLDHPLAAHHLATLRAKDTPPETFRLSAGRLSRLLVGEATRDLKTSPQSVETPMQTMTGARLSETIAIIPILRAGLGMVEPVLEMLPEAAVWHLGLYRNEETLEPVEYYQKLPKNNPPDVALVVDPMLATGGSATAALLVLQRWGVKRLKLLSLIAAPEGVKRVQSEFPNCQIYLAALDEKLNPNAYILPGLGDAGDRLFNTRK